jgi:hypothetical protein
MSRAQESSRRREDFPIDEFFIGHRPLGANVKKYIIFSISNFRFSGATLDEYLLR